MKPPRSGWLIAITWLPMALLAGNTSRMEISRSGKDCLISWNGTGILERATAPAGPWETVPQATNSPYRVSPADTSSFYRLRLAHRLNVVHGGQGSGTVTSSPGGIVCGADCEEVFAAGTIVTLTATPAAGSVFAGWGGDALGTEPCEILMEGPKTVTATFDLGPPPVGLINGDFEDGPDAGWDQQPYPLICRADQLGIQAASGQYVARLGPTANNHHSALIGQMVNLPNVWPLFLHFAVWIASEEICEAGLWDTVGTYVNGVPVLENARLCHSDNSGGWVRGSVDLSFYAGQTIQLVFAVYSPEFDPLASVVLFDDLYLDQWE